MPDLHTFFRARSTQRLCDHVLIKALSGSHFVATDFDSTKTSKRRPLAVNSQPSLSARANDLRSTGQDWHTIFDSHKDFSNVDALGKVF